MYSCKFNIVSSSDSILQLCTIQQRYSMYTKEENPDDRTTFHKLEQVDIHYYRNTVFYQIALYIYSLRITFCLSISLLFFFIFITYVNSSLNSHFIFCILIYYSNPVNELSYFWNVVNYKKTFWLYEKAETCRCYNILIIFQLYLHNKDCFRMLYYIYSTTYVYMCLLLPFTSSLCRQCSSFVFSCQRVFINFI